MPLRAIYKLVLEWRRRENGWTEDDARLVTDESDEWLNGLDELAGMIGLHLRYVIKAGAKTINAISDRTMSAARLAVACHPLQAGESVTTGGPSVAITGPMSRGCLS